MLGDNYKIKLQWNILSNNNAKPRKRQHTKKNEQRYSIWYERNEFINIINHRNNSLYTGSRKIKYLFKLSQPNTILWLNIIWKLPWKTLIFTTFMISTSKRLYIKINWIDFVIQFRCRMLTLRVYQLCTNNALKKSLKRSSVCWSHSHLKAQASRYHLCI